MRILIVCYTTNAFLEPDRQTEVQSWQSRPTSTNCIPFERSSKRRKGFPSETHVKLGDQVVHGDQPHYVRNPAIHGSGYVLLRLGWNGATNMVDRDRMCRLVGTGTASDRSMVAARGLLNALRTQNTVIDIHDAVYCRVSHVVRRIPANAPSMAWVCSSLWTAVCNARTASGTSVQTAFTSKRSSVLLRRASMDSSPVAWQPYHYTIRATNAIIAPSPSARSNKLPIPFSIPT